VKIRDRDRSASESRKFRDFAGLRKARTKNVITQFLKSKLFFQIKSYQSNHTIELHRAAIPMSCKIQNSLWCQEKSFGFCESFAPRMSISLLSRARMSLGACCQLPGKSNYFRVIYFVDYRTIGQSGYRVKSILHFARFCKSSMAGMKLDS